MKKAYQEGYQHIKDNNINISEMMQMMKPLGLR